jgi:hypothetical protein
MHLRFARSPHRTAPHRTALLRTAPHRTAPHRTITPVLYTAFACFGFLDLAHLLLRIVLIIKALFSPRLHLHCVFYFLVDAIRCSYSLLLVSASVSHPSSLYSTRLYSLPLITFVLSLCLQFCSHVASLTLKSHDTPVLVALAHVRPSRSLCSLPSGSIRPLAFWFPLSLSLSSLLSSSFLQRISLVTTAFELLYMFPIWFDLHEYRLTRVLMRIVQSYSFTLHRSPIASLLKQTQLDANG